MASTTTHFSCSSGSTTDHKYNSFAASRSNPSYYRDTLSSARKKLPPMSSSRPPTTSKYTYSGLLCAPMPPKREKDDDASCLASSSWQQSTPIKHSRTCPSCHPSAPLVRPSDAVGLDPNSSLARRLAYSSQGNKTLDPLPPKLREYFMYKSQSYTWRRVRLKREIKAYLASNVTIAPEYRILWCETNHSRTQIAENFTLEDDNRDDWLKSDLAKAMTNTEQTE